MNHDAGSTDPSTDQATPRFPVRRSGNYLRPDKSRMLLRPFMPGDAQRVCRIVQRILQLSVSEVEQELHNVKQHFSRNYDNIDTLFARRCRQLSQLMPPDSQPSPLQAVLIGAYFMSEYSLHYG